MSGAVCGHRCRQSVPAATAAAAAGRVLLAAVLSLAVQSLHRCDARNLNRRETGARRVDWSELGQKALNEALDLSRNENVAKNVILFLGDGMGISTVTAGRIYGAQKSGASGEEASLSFDKFPHVALAKTYNVNYQVPDSAGTATAFMSGVKANMGVIGVNQNVRKAQCDDMVTDGASNAADSVLRWSLNSGKRAGVITTTRITHATPAASYAHSPDRDWESDGSIPPAHRYRPNCPDIATQLIDSNSDINVIMGGGRKFFLPINGTFPDNGSRFDGRDLIQEWKDKMSKKGGRYVATKQDLKTVNVDTTDYLLGLFNDNHLRFRLETSSSDEPSLADMTETAIKILRRGNNGYFLLVEGGRIDHGHHAGVAKLALEEVLTFDETISRAVNLTDTKDTLIVVTADHSHTLTIGGYPVRGNPILGLVDPQGFAEEPSTDKMPYLTLAYANGPGAKGRTNLTATDTQADDFRQSALVPLGSETHGGEDVAIYASGPMSHLFHGVQEQHYVAHAMAYASCVGANRRHCTNPARRDADSDASAVQPALRLLFFVLVLAAGAVRVCSMSIA